MKCPHCLESFFEEWENLVTSERYITINDCEGKWSMSYCKCPSCEKNIIRLTNNCGYSQLVRPKSISRSPLPPEVSSEFAQDYKEACLILADSPKASAALSRRCLQNLLREKAKVKPDNLSKEIEEVINSNKLPTQLTEGIDAVRNIGNFAAHPTKSKSTGEIAEVEPGEAEWNLDILEGLFDFYFVQPEILKKKREKLNEKLTDLGKPPMK